MSNQQLQPFPISQLGSMVDKQPIGCVQGVITQIWKAKKGTTASTGNPWSIQNVVLRCHDGEVKLWVKDREEISMGWKNRTIRVECNQGEKGLTGLYVYDDDFNNKVERKLKVTPSANVFLIDETAGQRPAQQPQQQSTGTNQNGGQNGGQHFEERQRAAEESWADTERQFQGDPPPKQQTQRKKEAPDSFNEARRTVTQIANLHLLCAKAVDTYEAPALKKATGADMSESQRQGATASIFIEACKQGMVRNMPTTAIEL